MVVGSNLWGVNGGAVHGLGFESLTLWGTIAAGSGNQNRILMALCCKIFAATAAVKFQPELHVFLQTLT
jgi:hypothetical protein